MAFQLGNRHVGQGLGKLGQSPGVNDSTDILTAIADKDTDLRFFANHSGLKRQEFFLMLYFLTRPKITTGR